MKDINKKKKDNVIELDKYDDLIDDGLRERINQNKYYKPEKPIINKIIVKILAIGFLLLSLYALYTLIKPIMDYIINHFGRIDNSSDFFMVLSEAFSKNYDNLLVNILYGILTILNISASIMMFRLNNLGRIIHILVFITLLAIRTFYIFYKNMEGQELTVSIISILGIGIFIVILMTKPISKAF